ncbi:MAG: insulinase family protein [Clostridia bacterium]|nr:insulinase family protein [Clostridia bacterium]
MRKICLLLTLVVLIALAAAAFAGEPTEFEIPEIGTEINGFVVTDVYYWNMYMTSVVELEHQKTGSVLYWVANDSIDRSYTMAFHTPIYDDTGIAHVFEHATLGGSTKYPGANTFFEMGAKTSNTFLNASTGLYFTFYPMASTSEDQLMQYIDYYMNGLTDPLAISNPYAMMREAYRYELDDPEGEISLQGVVYSEMLGALTQPRMANYNKMRMMWPGSYISMISGGDPEHIPDLTIEALRNFHEKYYHPSNATMYLTGDLNLPRVLELLDTEFLSKYDRREIVFDDAGYKPIEPGYYEQVFPYPVEEGTPTENAAIIYYAHPYDVSEADYNDLNVLDYVGYYMNDESSPFKRMMRARLPEASATVHTPWNPGNKMEIDFVASDLNEADKDTFREICDEALAEVLKNGVDEKVLTAILTDNRFNQLMDLDVSSVYRELVEGMLSDWGIFGVRNAWKMDAEFNSHIEEFITVDHLNETARKYWSDMDTAVMAITVPEPGLKEQNDAALRKKLDDMKASMTQEEVDALVEQTRNYHAFVEESNQIVMPESLNALSVSTLPEEIPYKEAMETSINGIRLITSEVDSPLIRISLLNDASVIPFEELYDFMEFTSLIGQLGTDIYTREELPAQVSLVSASMKLLNVGIEENPDSRTYDFSVVTSWYTLPDLLEDSFAVVNDILYHTDFSDYDYIRSDAAQSVSAYMNSLSSNSLNIAASTMYSTICDALKLSKHLRGDAYIRYLMKVSRMSDEEMDALTAKFEHYRDLVLNQNSAILTVMGNEENLLRATALGYNMIRGFDNEKHETVDYAKMFQEVPKHTAIVTGGNVVYNIEAVDLEAAGFDQYDGGFSVISGMLDDKLLYPELRVKNSAYGGYSIQSDYIFFFYSYRDPKVAETYQVYSSAGEFLRSLEISESEMEGYIISAYGNLTYPVGPLSSALSGISDKIYHRDSHAVKMRKLLDIKAFTPADVAKYAPVFDRFGTDEAVRVTSGGKTMIESASELFDEINYDLINLAGEDGTLETASEQ